MSSLPWYIGLYIKKKKYILISMERVGVVGVVGVANISDKSEIQRTRN